MLKKSVKYKDANGTYFGLGSAIFRQGNGGRVEGGGAQSGGGNLITQAGRNGFGSRNRESWRSRYSGSAKRGRRIVGTGDQRSWSGFDGGGGDRWTAIGNAVRYGWNRSRCGIRNFNRNVVGYVNGHLLDHLVRSGLSYLYGDRTRHNYWIRFGDVYVVGLRHFDGYGSGHLDRNGFGDDDRVRLVDGDVVWLRHVVREFFVEGFDADGRSGMAAVCGAVTAGDGRSSVADGGCGGGVRGGESGSGGGCETGGESGGGRETGGDGGGGVAGGDGWSGGDSKVSGSERGCCCGES